MNMPNSRRSEWSMMLASTAEYIDGMLPVEDKEFSKNLKTIRTLCLKGLKQLLEGLDMDTANGILRQAKQKRLVLQTTAAGLPDPANTRVVTIDQLNTLINMDLVECVGCEKTGKQRNRCPIRRTLKSLDVDVDALVCEMEDC